MNDAQSTQSATTVTPRKKSAEATLKLQMRTIVRDLKKVGKQVTEFEALKKEMAGADARKEKLNTDLNAVKTKLIKEMGLG